MLAVSIALSVVIANNIEDGAVRRFGALASTEAQLASDAGVTAFGNARLAAIALRNSTDQAEALLRLSGGTGTPDDVALTTDNLRKLSEEFRNGLDPRIGPMLVITPTSGAAAVFGTTDNGTILALAGDTVVAEALASGVGRQSAVVASGLSYGLAAEPIVIDRTLAGAVVVTTMLDASYLQIRSAGARGEIDGFALTLATSDAVLAADGPQPSLAQVEELARAALSSGSGTTTFAGGRFLAAEPVLSAGGAPVMAILVSVPTASIDQTRENLFRVLFLVALGAAMAALLLAALVGERIGAGLRRLTAAATEIRHGNLDASAQVSSEDELGVLSATFDSMTGSLRTMTAELRAAADDEARLRGRLEAVVGRHERRLGGRRRPRRRDRLQRRGRGAVHIPARKAVGRPVTSIVALVATDGTDLTARLAPPGARDVDRDGERPPARRRRGPGGGVGRYPSGVSQPCGRRRLRVPRHSSGARGGADENRVPRQHQP